MTIWEETRSLTIYAPRLESEAYVFISPWDLAACSGIRGDNYMSKHPSLLFSVGMLGAKHWNDTLNTLISEHLHPVGVLASDCVKSNCSGWKTEWVVIGFINWTAETDEWKNITDDLHQKMSCFAEFWDYMDFSGTICVFYRPTGQYKYNVVQMFEADPVCKKRNWIEKVNSLSESCWIYQSICSLSITMPTKPTRSVSLSLKVNLLLHRMLSPQMEKFSIWHYSGVRFFYDFQKKSHSTWSNAFLLRLRLLILCWGLSFALIKAIKLISLYQKI